MIWGERATPSHHPVAQPGDWHLLPGQLWRLEISYEPPKSIKGHLGPPESTWGPTVTRWSSSGGTYTPLVHLGDQV